MRPAIGMIIVQRKDSGRRLLPDLEPRDIWPRQQDSMCGGAIVNVTPSERLLGLKMYSWFDLIFFEDILDQTVLSLDFLGQCRYVLARTGKRCYKLTHSVARSQWRISCHPTQMSFFNSPGRKFLSRSAQRDQKDLDHVPVNRNDSPVGGVVRAVYCKCPVSLSRCQQSNNLAYPKHTHTHTHTLFNHGFFFPCWRKILKDCSVFIPTSVGLMGPNEYSRVGLLNPISTDYLDNR